MKMRNFAMQCKREDPAILRKIVYLGYEIFLYSFGRHYVIEHGIFAGRDNVLAWLCFLAVAGICISA